MQRRTSGKSDVSWLRDGFGGSGAGHGAADLALGQVAFIDYVVQPLFAAAQKIFPEVSELEANCRQNREAWRALGARASADRASG